MEEIIEGDLSLSYSEEFVASKFDDGKSHGLSHCMKAVDFILENKTTIYLIEFKDPDAPKAKMRKTLDERLKDIETSKIIQKCRDTFLYLHLSTEINKKIVYLVLIAAEALETPQLLAKTEELKRQLPLNGPNKKQWQKPFIESCVVMNIETWNRNLAAFPIRRISDNQQ